MIELQMKNHLIKRAEALANVKSIAVKGKRHVAWVRLILIGALYDRQKLTPVEIFELTGVRTYTIYNYLRDRDGKCFAGEFLRLKGLFDDDSLGNEDLKRLRVDESFVPGELAVIPASAPSIDCARMLALYSKEEIRAVLMKDIRNGLWNKNKKDWNCGDWGEFEGLRVKLDKRA